MAKTKSGFYGQKENRVSTLKEWMNDNERTEGYTFLNARYTKAFKRCGKELGKAGMLNYFMVAHLGINDCRAMMLSAKKQSGLIGVALTQMNQYRIEPEAERIFKNNVTYFEKRIDHIMRITMENLRWHNKDNLTYCDRINYGYGYKFDDFCSYGERKTNRKTEPQRDGYDKGLQLFADILFDKEKSEQFLKECKAMGIEPQEREGE